MGLRNGAYAKIWEVKKGNGKYYDARISTSRKMPDGSYETDFSGFVRLIGKAAADAESFNGGERVRIGEFEVTNKFDKEKRVTYTNYAVFTFLEEGDNPTQQRNTANNQQRRQPEPDIDGELPFN